MLFRSAVDRAEVEEDLAIAINGAAPAEMALACAALNIPLLHISTDYVFAGTGHLNRAGFAGGSNS